jgi:RNA polymerase sigma-70 factor, ECF subfamily
VSTPTEPITILLQLAAQGDLDAHERLYGCIHAELRRIARKQLVRLRAGATLQPTELVHEAYLRLVNVADASFANRRYFFALTARIMRGLIVDHARSRGARLRRAPKVAVGRDTQNEIAAPERNAIDLLDLGLALEDLAGIDAELASVAELRYLAGLGIGEIAAMLATPVRTVERRLQVANSWLRCRLHA